MPLITPGKLALFSRLSAYRSWWAHLLNERPCQHDRRGGADQPVVPDYSTQRIMTIRKLICEPVLGALLPLGLIVSLGPVAIAQQPVQPLPKVGGCPLGYYSSGSYCVPSKSGNTRGALEKTGNSCPLGFYSSGNYCVSSPSNNREAIQKQGNSCPLGWYSSGSYCVKSR